MTEARSSAIRRRPLLGIILVALVLAALGAAYLAGWILGSPSISASGNVPIVTTLSSPLNGSGYPSNTFIPVSAKAVGSRPLTALELWVDGTLSQKREWLAPDAQRQAEATWSWVPGKEGSHQLLVKAIDAGGAVSVSNVVTVLADLPAEPRVLHQAGQGESLQSISQRLGTTAEKLKGLNPDLDPSGALEAGQTLFLPLDVASRLEGAGGTAATAGSWTGIKKPVASWQPPAASLSSGTTGSAGSAGSGSMKDAQAESGAGADVRVVGSKLIVPGGLEKIYYYLWVDGSIWSRVPDKQDDFIPPMSVDDSVNWAKEEGASGGEALGGLVKAGNRRIFDLASYFGPQAQSAAKGERSISIEVWGWEGSGPRQLGQFGVQPKLPGANGLGLLPLGSATLAMCGHSGSCTEGLGWTSEIIVPSDEKDQARQFQWTSETFTGSEVLWQLSSVPFSGEFDPAPPGMVAAKVLSGKEGSFHFDFAGLAGQSSEPPLPAATPVPPSSQKSPLFSVYEGLLKPNAAAMKGTFTFSYYARVVPMDGNKPAGKPSSTIVIHHGPKPEQEPVKIWQPPKIFDVSIEGFRPVVFAKGGLFGCVTITKNEVPPEIKSSPSAALYGLFPVGKVICPAGYKGMGEKPWYEQLADFIESGIEWVAKAYENLKNAVVSGIAAFIPGCDDTCKELLKAGINAALVAAGLPPSIPSFDALSEAAAGELVGMLAAQAGVDCTEGSPCWEAIKAGVKELKESASAGGNNDSCMSAAEAHGHGVEPLCLPKGVVGIPVKGANFEPGYLMVKVKRIADIPPDSGASYDRYRLSLTSTGSATTGSPMLLPVNTYIISGQYEDSHLYSVWVDVAQPVEGVVFTGGQKQMPKLGLGESITIPMPLVAPPYWIPEHAAAIKKEGGYVRWDDWSTIYMRATLRFGVRVTYDAPFTGNTPPDLGSDGKEFDGPSDWYDY